MTKRSARGFTLIEVIIFIVVVSVGLTGILLVSDTVVKSSADPMVRKQAVAIAESLLEEILLKEYAAPVGGGTGATRATYDHVDQYNGYTTAAGITDATGAAVPGLGSYNIAPPVVVAVTTDLPGTAAKKVTVSVTGPGGVIALSGYRSNY